MGSHLSGEREKLDPVMTQVDLVSRDVRNVRREDSVEQGREFQKIIEVNWVLFVPEGRRNAILFAPIDDAANLGPALLKDVGPEIVHTSPGALHE